MFTKISNYFQNLFGGNCTGNSTEQIFAQNYNSIYVPQLTYIPTQNSLNFNIFDNNFTFDQPLNTPTSQIFNFSPMNFDMFTYRGFEKVTLSSDKTENSEYGIQFWKDQGYNEEKGKLLAQKAKSRAKGKSQHQCAAYVRRAINAAFKTNYTGFDHAAIVGERFLVNDKNFKKVEVDMSKINPLDIPTGAIVIYPSKGYSSSKAGHIEIADEISVENGKTVRRGISDFKSKSLCQNWGKRKNPAEIWIPV